MSSSIMCFKCLFTPADRMQPPEKTSKPTFLVGSVRLVFLVEESSHLEARVVSQDDVGCNSDAFATHQSSQSGCDTSGYDLFSLRQRCPHDRLNHIHRFLQEPLRISRKTRQPIRELDLQSCRYPLDSPFHSFGRPMLVPDPSPKIHTCVNSPRVSCASIATPTGASLSP